MEPREKVQFSTNVPEVVSLAFADGKPIEGQYGDQIMWGLDGNRVMFVPPIVGVKIAEAGIRAHEPIRITKAETRRGNRRSIEWQVERVEEQSAAPAQEPATTTPVQSGAAASSANGRTQQNPPADNPNDSTGSNGNGAKPGNGHPTLPRKVSYGDAIARALIAAIDAAARAEAHAAANSAPVRFTSQDIQGLASTIFIQASREGWVDFANVGQS